MNKLRFGAGRTSVSMVGAAAYTLGLVACAGQSTDESVAQVHGNLTGEASANALSSGESCDELLGRLQNGLLTQVSERAEQARVSGAPYYGGGVFIDDVVPSFGGAVVGASAAAPAPAPALSVASVSSSSFSETTVQVPGVDQGDFVKAEGDRIYLVSGAVLYVLNAAAAEATELVASVPIEGEAYELLVHDGRVAVLSTIYGSLEGTEEVYSPYYYYYPTYAKLTVVDATSATPNVAREAYVEGYYSYSRLHGSVMRAVLQQSSKAQLDYPSVSYVDIFGHPRSQTEIDLQVDLWQLLATESIEDSVIEDYLPATYERIGGALVREPLRCSDYLVPGPGLTQVGATSVISLDLDTVDAPLGAVTVLGASDSVYAGNDSLILRLTDYADYAAAIPSVTTRLHRFALDGDSTTYTASGSVAGYVNGQHALDEYNGVIRAAVLSERYGTDADAGGGIVYLGSDSHVVTLAVALGELTELGRTPDVSGDEYFYTAQFLGDRGYVFTSGVPNRLSVVDLSNPAAPSFAGQLPTTTYTSVLIPLSTGTLLGLGQGNVPSGFQNVAVQLFDVSDSSAPSLIDEYVLSESGYSEALGDPRAVTFHPRRNLLAFQHQSYTTGLTSLEVFGFSPEQGINHVGSVIPEAVEPTLLECLTFFGYPTDPEFLAQLEQDPALAESLLQQCRSYNQQYVRRGLFRGNAVYAVSSTSVAAYSLDALAGPPLSQVDLPSSNYFGFPVPVSPPVIVTAPPADEASE
jgi:inhibitor of cysteine peptidase